MLNNKVNGHYQELVDLIGGGVICYWAKNVEGEDLVSLQYITSKGRPSGIHVAIISNLDFKKKFCLCTPHICPILEKYQDLTHNGNP